MNYVASMTERTILAVEYFLDRAMEFLWASTLHRLQPPGEEDYGGGDICSLQEAADTEDDRPLD